MIGFWEILFFKIFIRTPLTRKKSIFLIPCQINFSRGRKIIGVLFAFESGHVNYAKRLGWSSAQRSSVKSSLFLGQLLIYLGNSLSNRSFGREILRSTFNLFDVFLEQRYILLWKTSSKECYFVLWNTSNCDFLRTSLSWCLLFKIYMERLYFSLEKLPSQL